MTTPDWPAPGSCSPPSPFKALAPIAALLLILAALAGLARLSLAQCFAPIAFYAVCCFAVSSARRARHLFRAK